MSEFTINLRLTASQELIDAIKLIVGITPIKPPQEEKVSAKEEKAPKAVKAKEADPPAIRTADAPITIEVVRDRISTKSKEGKREEIKALLKEFNVERATDLKEDQYPLFLEKLAGL